MLRSSVLLRLCVVAVSIAGSFVGGDEGAAALDPCAQSSPGLLDMALEPLSANDFVFGTEADEAVFENEVYEVVPRDIHYFGSLNFTSHMIFHMMDSIVSIEADKLGQPAVQGEDYYLVKRVRGKDGEWWSGRVPDAYNNASTAYRWFRRGFTLVLNNADSRHVQLAAFANGLEDELGYMVQLNAYLTPPTSQGFEVHWDPMETLIIQLEGQKTWSVYDPIIELPRPEQRFKPTSKQVNYSSLVEMHMEEGAALYLPRGWLHEATTNHSETQGRHSLHLTIGIEAQYVTWEQVMHSVLIIAAQTQPGALTSENRAAEVAISAKGMLHWAIRGVALDSPLLRRALLPSSRESATLRRKKEEATCAAAIAEMREQLSMAAVQRAAEQLGGAPDLQLQSQLESEGAGDAAALVEEKGRQQLLRAGAAEKVFEKAKTFFLVTAAESCPAGIAYVRESAEVELRKRQETRRKRLVMHGMPCAQGQDEPPA